MPQLIKALEDCFLLTQQRRGDLGQDGCKEGRPIPHDDVSRLVVMKWAPGVSSKSRIHEVSVLKQGSNEESQPTCKLPTT